MQVEDEPKAGAPEWMVTFADLMSLLLTFFVLLLSFSSVEVEKFRQMSGSIKEAFGVRSDLAISDHPQSDDILPVIDTDPGSPAQAAEQVRQELNEMLKQTGLERRGGTEITPDGVVLQLSGDLFFDSGNADLNPAAFPVLDKIAEELERSGRNVDVIGHTDDIPISTAVYPSNWELSAARAGQAVRYLAEKGVEASHLRAIGQAQTAPIASNRTPAGRTENRRVEFLFRVNDQQDAAVKSPSEIADE